VPDAANKWLTPLACETAKNANRLNQWICGSLNAIYKAASKGRQGQENEALAS
jgi:hypothetical protein